METKIALDVDGVLANFNHGFIEHAKRKGYGEHFPNSPDEITEWYYAERDYIDHLFGMIAKDIKFWLGLPRYPDTPIPLPFTPVAYVTARPIPSIITLDWLIKQGLPKAPVFTVKEGEEKLQVLKGIDSPIFVDDKMETIQALNDGGITCYCMDRGWNQLLDVKYPRIKNLKELVDDKRIG